MTTEKIERPICELSTATPCPKAKVGLRLILEPLGTFRGILNVLEIFGAVLGLSEALLMYFDGACGVLSTRLDSCQAKQNSCSLAFKDPTWLSLCQPRLFMQGV